MFLLNVIVMFEFEIKAETNYPNMPPKEDHQSIH